MPAAPLLPAGGGHVGGEQIWAGDDIPTRVHFTDTHRRTRRGCEPRLGASRAGTRLGIGLKSPSQEGCCTEGA